ncbi:pentapeptide repeat-containing protein [Achromobacter sp. UBA4530]|uniref:pentapeptide repeat-containing protein n=1 Tax=Achromobacter sp. UBA4530 TaxID=1945912 RepID=UPI0039C8A6F4
MRQADLRQAILRQADLRQANQPQARRRSNSPPAVPDQLCGSAISRPALAASSSRSLNRATASANTRA